MTIGQLLVDAVEAGAAAAKSAADTVLELAQDCADAVTLYSTNYVVTSTVYVQSIGGVPYDPSNQTINVQSVSLTPTEVQIVATVRQTPLVPPALDWRAASTPSVNPGATPAATMPTAPGSSGGSCVPASDGTGGSDVSTPAGYRPRPLR